jgi:hypothetical protein
VADDQSEPEHIYQGEKPEIEKIHGLYENSWALIVGINDYNGNYGSLANALNDARDLEKILKENYGFKNTILLEDKGATRGNILNHLLNILPRELQLNDRFIFYFSGHGATRVSEEKNIKYGYIIPHDAKPRDKKGDYPYYDYIEMSEIIKACGLMDAKHIFIILDSCFSGLAAIKGESISIDKIDETYIEKITRKKAWQVLTAGGADEFVMESGFYSGHSPFTGALLAGLKGSADKDHNFIITAMELSDYVQKQVIEDTKQYMGKSQTPIYNYLPGSGEGGNLVFLLPGFGSDKKVPKDTFKMMKSETYPDYIYKKIYLVHEWKEEPGIMDDFHMKWFYGNIHKKWFNVKIWLDAYSDSELDNCTRVTYRLDDSFSQNVISSDDRKNFFEIQLIIWGEFTVIAHVERAKGDPLIVTRYLDIPGSFHSVHSRGIWNKQ